MAGHRKEKYASLKPGDKIFMDEIKPWEFFVKEILEDLEQSRDPLKSEDFFDELFIKCKDKPCPILPIEKQYRINHLSGDGYYPNPYPNPLKSWKEVF